MTAGRQPTPRDGVVGHAEKTFLWHFDTRWFRAGTALRPIDTPVGRLGVLICADGRIPTIAAHLVDAGAEALVIPTAWVTSGRDPARRENIQADLFIGVRARENGVPLIAANKCGVERRSVAYCGKSALVAADGTLIAQASEDQEETLAGHIALGPSFIPRPRTIPVVERGRGIAFDERARVGFSARHDPALHAIAAEQGSAIVIDPHTTADALPATCALIEDEAVLDPRALVSARLNGVSIFVWRASIEAEWIPPFARTRAAELRAYLIALDTRGRRAFAADPDGAIIAGTFTGYDLAGLTWEHARSEQWHVAPGSSVADGLRDGAAIIERDA